jgi:hypothetical protein
MPSFLRMLLVRLVVVGAVVFILPFIMLFLLIALPLLALVFYLAVNDVTQDTLVSATPSTSFLRWSDASSRVPIGTLPMVFFMTPTFVLLVMDWIRCGCCVQHRLEALNMRVDFFVIFGKMRGDLINEHP